MKLTLDLVPASCFFTNVRAFVSKKQWDTIRFKVYSKAYDTCEICGGIGPAHAVECHEIFEYNDSELIQKLTGMIALCPNCHNTKHFGLSELQGKRVKILKHFMKVNKVNKTDAEKYISEQFIIWAKRSKYRWALDISLLKDYGINVEKIEENKKA
jgi:5-methylcytosine-specific restriction endonuclease McrA